MAFSAVEVTEDDLKAGAEAAQSFKAVPAGTYDFTVTGVTEEPYPGKGANAGRPSLNVKLRVIDSAPVGAKRVFFKRIPLFGKWAPTEKNPNGYPALGDLISFAIALGVPKEVAEKGSLPLEVRDILGKPVSAYIQLREADDFNDHETNQVGSIRPPRPAAAAATAPKTAVANPWASTPTVAAPAATVASPWGSAPAGVPALAGKGF